MCVGGGGLFYVTSFNKKKNIITYIDVCSHYGYVYLLHDNSQAIDAFEVFVNEFERQITINMKVVKSDRDHEYHERYNETA